MPSGTGARTGAGLDPASYTATGSRNPADIGQLTSNFGILGDILADELLCRGINRAASGCCGPGRARFPGDDPSCTASNPCHPRHGQADFGNLTGGLDHFKDRQSLFDCPLNANSRISFNAWRPFDKAWQAHRIPTNRHLG